MTNERGTENKRSGWQTVGLILKILVRLTLVIIVGALIGAAIYYGIPWVHRTFVVPVEQNAEDIGTLEREVAGLQEQVETRTGAIQERMADMEGELAGIGETSAVNDQRLATAVSVLSTLQPQASALATTVTAQDEALAELEGKADSLSAGLATQEAQLQDQAEALATMEEQLQQEISELGAQLSTVTADQAVLMGRLALLQAAQDLLRVRLLLAEDNPGTAQEAVQVAVEHTTRAAGLWPAISGRASELVARMETLTSLIEERSFRAAPTLEALWADVVALAVPAAPPGSPPLPTLTPTPGELEAEEAEAETVTATPTAEATPTATPTPTTTPTPTPTPTPES